MRMMQVVEGIRALYVCPLSAALWGSRKRTTKLKPSTFCYASHDYVYLHVIPVAAAKEKLVCATIHFLAAITGG